MSWWCPGRCLLSWPCSKKPPSCGGSAAGRATAAKGSNKSKSCIGRSSRAVPGGQPGLAVGAQAPQGADRAGGVAGGADPAAVAQEVDVQLVILARRRERAEDVVGLGE